MVRRPDQVVRFLAGVNFNHKIGRGLEVCLANGEPSVSRLDASNHLEASDRSFTDTACPGSILLVEQQVSLNFGQRPKQTLKRLSRRTVLANQRHINHCDGCRSPAPLNSIRWTDEDDE